MEVGGALGEVRGYRDGRSRRRRQKPQPKQMDEPNEPHRQDGLYRSKATLRFAAFMEVRESRKKLWFSTLP